METNIVHLPKEPVLYDNLVSLVEKVGGIGGILIIETSSKNKIIQYNLSSEQIRKNLCLAIYYNEKIAIEDTENKE